MSQPPTAETGGALPVGIPASAIAEESAGSPVRALEAVEGGFDGMAGEPEPEGRAVEEVPRTAAAGPRERGGEAGGRGAREMPEMAARRPREASGEARTPEVERVARQEGGARPEGVKFALDGGERVSEAPAGERRFEDDAGPRELTSEPAAGPGEVQKRNEGNALRNARNEARPLSAQARDVLGQVARAAESAVRFSRVTVELRPPELGTIQIAVESREGNLSARFQASHPTVRAWLESNAVALRSELSEAGLAFQNMSFSTAGQEQGGRWGGHHYEAAPRGAFPDLPEDARPKMVDQAAATHTGVAEWRA